MPRIKVIVPIVYRKPNVYVDMYMAKILPQRFLRFTGLLIGSSLLGSTGSMASWHKIAN